MEQKVLSNLDGVSLYGILSILIFFAFFTGMLLWAVRLKKTYLNSMRDLPLDGEITPQTPTEKNSKPETQHE